MFSNGKIDDGKWHHVVWSSDGTTSRMYIDGRFDSELNQDRKQTSGTSYISFDYSQAPFNGSISQVAVYTETLGLAQVHKLYAEGPQQFFAQK